MIGTTDNNDQGPHDAEVQPRPDPARPRDRRRPRSRDLGRGHPADPPDQRPQRADRRQHPPGRPGRVLRRALADPRQRLSGARPPAPPRTASSPATAPTTWSCKGNRAKPAEPAGKTWRFLVLTARGSGDRVEDNTSSRPRPPRRRHHPLSNAARDHPHRGLHLHLRGEARRALPRRPAAADPRPRAGRRATGDVVSILAGPEAGQLRRIAQVIDPQTYLLDAPLPRGRRRLDLHAVSSTRRFRATGSTCAGRAVRGHWSSWATTSGPGSSTTTARRRRRLADHRLPDRDAPCIWGWSHAPFLARRIEGNIIEDRRGAGRSWGWSTRPATSSRTRGGST